jgi:hypothetical protein
MFMGKTRNVELAAGYCFPPIAIEHKGKHDQLAATRDRGRDALSSRTP